MPATLRLLLLATALLALACGDARRDPLAGQRWGGGAGGEDVAGAGGARGGEESGGGGGRHGGGGAIGDGSDADAATAPEPPEIGPSEVSAEPGRDDFGATEPVPTEPQPPSPSPVDVAPEPQACSLTRTCTSCPGGQRLCEGACITGCCSDRDCVKPSHDGVCVSGACQFTCSRTDGITCRDERGCFPAQGACTAITLPQGADDCFSNLCRPPNQVCRRPTVAARIPAQPVRENPFPNQAVPLAAICNSPEIRAELRRLICANAPGREYAIYPDTHDHLGNFVSNGGITIAHETCPPL